MSDIDRSDLDRNVDRWLSALVRLLPAEVRAPDGATISRPAPNVAIPEGVHIAPAPGEATREVKVPVAVAQVARIKQYFANTGFEVHAPVGATFSIGGKQSAFERYFNVELTVDESQLGCPVSTLSGDRHLTLETLPEEFKVLVESITFPPAVEVPGMPT